jgi:hypothetical protein
MFKFLPSGHSPAAGEKRTEPQTVVYAIHPMLLIPISVWRTLILCCIPDFDERLRMETSLHG